jgi:hypothetical protein
VLGDPVGITPRACAVRLTTRSTSAGGGGNGSVAAQAVSNPSNEKESA